MNEADTATDKLAAELQLEDVNTILAEMKSGNDSDERATFKAMQAFFRDIIQVYESKLFALNALRLEHATRVECQRLVQEEKQARADHDLARSPGGLPPRAPPDPSLEFEGMFKRRFEAGEGNNGKGSSRASSSTSHSAAARNLSRAPEVAGSSKGKRKAESDPLDDEKERWRTHGLCVACLERHPRFDLLELSCKRENDEAQHAYCRKCLNELFKASLTDTTLFPPRCCGVRIPLFAGVHFFTPELISKYEEKEIELATPNPVYCSNRACAIFVNPHHVTADIATCPACNAKTCAVCKNSSHQGLCPDDPTVQQLMKVAGKNKWQRCYKCRTMVELVAGCYHMSCPCGSEFCYLCAKPWKTCKCAQWDETNLVNNARELCNDNHRWNRAYGRNGNFEACDVCDTHLRYLNHCRECDTMVCNRCLNNRL